MALVILSDFAECDLIDIEYYIFERLSNPQAAQRIVNGIFGVLKQIEEYPEAHPVVYNNDAYLYDIRQAHFEGYNIFYRINKNEQMVEIIRILSERVHFEDRI